MTEMRKRPGRPEPKSSTKNLMPRAVALGAVEGVLAKAMALWRGGLNGNGWSRAIAPSPAPSPQR